MTTSLLAQDMDFADVLHLSGCGHCEALYTFDDRRFARRAQHLGMGPAVSVPTGQAQSGQLGLDRFGESA